MTLVSSSVTYATNALWQSAVPVSTDPSWQVNVQLQNFVSGLSGTPLTIRKGPADCTTKNSTVGVRWIITKTGSMGGFYGSLPVYHGFQFMVRNGDAGTTSYAQGNITKWFDSTANNNSGDFTVQVNTASIIVASLTATNPVINTVYENDVALPWFVCWQGQGTGTFSGIFKIDNSVMGGDQRGNEGWGDGWIMINGFAGSISSCYMSVRGVQEIPNAHINVGASSATRQFWQQPVSNQAFLGPSMGKGLSGWLGMPNGNSYVTSSTTTGAFLDTCVIGGRTYTKATSRLWVRTA